MACETNSGSSLIKRIGSVVLVVLLLLLAWGGYLDIYSHDYLAASIKNTGILYGIIRGINALVSVLQSSELSVMLVSVNIGELLDPLNDLIERFSHVLVVALAALVLQKIMLGIVSHDMFNLAMSALTLIVLYSSLIRKLPFHSYYLRAFILALFLRFALAIAVLCGSLIDSWFLEQAMTEQVESMVQLENQLSNTRDVLSGETRVQGLEGEPAQRLQQAERKKRQIVLALDQTRQAIAHAEADIHAIKAQLPWHEALFPPAWPDDLIARNQALEQLESRQRQIENELETIDGEIEAIDEVLECISLRAQGQSCSVWDWFENIRPYEKYKETLSSIADSMDVYVENIVDLIVGLLLKSVILPLLFFYGIYRGARLLWSLPVE